MASADKTILNRLAAQRRGRQRDPGHAVAAAQWLRRALGLLIGTANAAPVPPPAEDLGETTEVRFTTAIQDLANQLGNDPVAIYHWVRNNIAFVPTWGSLYGADFCLSLKACNAFDTSSLLIALYRVANIPAHYVRGQIRVPIEQATRWFRADTPDAALAKLTTGGVPATFVTNEAGDVTAIQLEARLGQGLGRLHPVPGRSSQAGRPVDRPRRRL